MGKVGGEGEEGGWGGGWEIEEKSLRDSKEIRRVNWSVRKQNKRITKRLTPRKIIKLKY